MAMSGYEVEGAADFWRKMAAIHPGSISKSFWATHPSSPERFVAIEQIVKEIKEKQQTGQPLVPDLK